MEHLVTAVKNSLKYAQWGLRNKKSDISFVQLQNTVQGCQRTNNFHMVTSKS